MTALAADAALPAAADCDYALPVAAAGDYALRYIEPAAPQAPPLLVVRPATLQAQAAPLVVSVHGYTRQPLEHLRAFAPLAVRHGFALALPLFDERHHRRYQQLLHPRRGTRSDLALLAALEAAAPRHGLDASRLFLFGHSGGGQFVHRFAMCHPRRTVALAIGAAGWYTWPDPALPWPAGVGAAEQSLGAPIDLERFLRLPMALWVGEKDTAAGETLRDSPELALQQGANRSERATRWAQAVRAAAAARGVDNALAVAELPSAGHDFGGCVRRADLARRVMAFFVRHR